MLVSEKEEARKTKIDKIRLEPDKLRRKLKFLGLLTRLLKPEGVVPILVGGTALEFYTFGEYATGDIDLVLPERKKAAQVLEALGFQRAGRHWYSEEVDIAVEIPGDTLAGAIEKVVSVFVDGERIYVIGPEDLIVDRLNAAKFWNVRSDLDWAAGMLLLHSNKIDIEYLREAAAKGGISDFLAQAVERCKEMQRKKDGGK